MSTLINSFQEKFLNANPILAVTLSLLGLYTLSKTVNSLISVAIDTLAPRKPQLKHYQIAKAKDALERPWAVVTGCTAGIGEEFAHQIAKQKFNVVLVSRNLNKLNAVAAQLQEHYQVQTKVFVLDAATADINDFQNLAAFVQTLKVSILVNNLGISHEMPTPFSEVSNNELKQIIHVNCYSTLEITKAVLPSIQETRKTTGAKGLILTMGSFAGLTPTPLLSVYSGSKLFLQGWSSALAEELKPEGIDVQIVLSYLVTSQMSKVRRTSMLIPNPKNFVKSTLRQIGLNGGAQERAYTLTPYWSHAIMHWAINTVLGVYSGLVSKINYGMHVDIRKRALRKKERAEKSN